MTNFDSFRFSSPLLRAQKIFFPLPISKEEENDVVLHFLKECDLQFFYRFLTFFFPKLRPTWRLWQTHPCFYEYSPLFRTQFRHLSLGARVLKSNPSELEKKRTSTTRQLRTLKKSDVTPPSPHRWTEKHFTSNVSRRERATQKKRTFPRTSVCLCLGSLLGMEAFVKVPSHG